MENHADSLRNPPARVQFQPTAVGLALRCARIAFAVTYPEFTLIRLSRFDPKSNIRNQQLQRRVMNCCSHHRGLNRIFTSNVAQRELENFRRKGLDKRDSHLAKAIAQRGVQGATILEVGGGIGAIQIELLKAGAARAMNVDLAAAYATAARELTQALGYAAVTEQRVADFAHEANTIAAADVVIMNRVICCYPDMPALVRPAAQHARRLLALVFPRETWWMKLGGRVMNFGLWLVRNDFRFFLHPHDAIISATAHEGLQPILSWFSGPWRLMLFERMADSA
jgi:magnesium-protoporphyrin O-methyltransferase